MRGVTNRLRPKDVTTVCKTTTDPEDVPDSVGLADIDHFAQFIRGTMVPPRDQVLAATTRPRIKGKSSLNASDAPTVMFPHLPPRLPVRSLTEECLPFQKHWATKPSIHSVISFCMTLEQVMGLCKWDRRIRLTSCEPFHSGSAHQGTLYARSQVVVTRRRY